MKLMEKKDKLNQAYSFYFETFSKNKSDENKISTQSKKIIKFLIKFFYHYENAELKNNASKKTAKNNNNNVNVNFNEAPFRVYNFSTSKKINLCFR